MKKILLTILLLLAFFQLIAYENPTLEDVVKKAEAGDPRAQATLAEYYIRGTNEVERDLATGLEWLNKSYAQNDPFAAYLWGYLTITGVPGQKTPDEYFQEAYSGIKQMADQGDPEATLKLAAFYRYGWVVQQDNEKADDLLEKAAEAGVPRAIYILGFSKLSGNGMEPDYQGAFKLLSKISSENEEAQYQVANMLYAGLGTEAEPDTALKILRKIQKPNETTTQVHQKNDYIIPNLLPPTYSLSIQEGSCGENVLWTICKRLGKEKTQYEINYAGGNPGRGLRSNELFFAMDSLGIPYKEYSRRFNSTDENYENKNYQAFVYDHLVSTVLSGNPVLIGVKVYPTEHPEWPFDHFILLVGYNENSKEFIYNDFNRRVRITTSNLLSVSQQGYSFINDFDFLFSIEFYDLDQ